MFNLHLKKMIIFRANILFALCFFASSTSYSSDWKLALEKSKELKLYEHSQWLRLGHYRCGIFGCTSEQDGSSFFIAKNGKDNPEAELIATIEALISDTNLKTASKLPQKAICQFPARATWIANMTGQSITSEIFSECTEYLNFQKRSESTGISFVFSSFYLNNPSSVYGHTLLKIHRKATENEGQKADLLNYGVNYAANPTTKIPILYAMMGLLGGFNGTFTLMPYYYKVREYSDFEARDLWEYDLNLNAEQRNILIMHLWELGSGYFDYYYLSENCSYHLLALLEVAVPTLNVVDPLPYWVIPSDTVKSIMSQKDFVKSVNFRPSLARQLESRYSSLNTEQKNSFHKAVANFDISNLDLDASTLDAIIDQFDLTYGKELVGKNIDILNKKHLLLLKRSQLKETTALTFNRPDAPHLAHDSLRMFLAYGETNDNSAIYFENRFAFHDLTDPTIGMPRPGRIEMFQAEISYLQKTKKLRPERFRLAGVEALNPWSPLWKKPAWRFDMGGERINDQRCTDCWAGLVAGSIGLAKSLDFFKIELTPFIYANLRFRYANLKGDNLSTEYSPSVGIRFLGPNNLNIISEIEKKYFFDEKVKHPYVSLTTLQKSINSSTGIRAQYEKSYFYENYKLGVVVFF